MWRWDRKSNRKFYIIIIIISLTIGLIVGLAILKSLNLCLTILFNGIWICYTIIFIKKVNLHKKSYNYRNRGNSYNTSFFTMSPLVIGLFYSVWGYWTGLPGWNLFGTFPLYCSIWTLVFATPYLTYGLYSLYSCFERYDRIFMGSATIDSHTHGVSTSILAILLSMCGLLSPVGNQNSHSMWTITHTTPDLLLIIAVAFSAIISLKYVISTYFA